MIHGGLVSITFRRLSPAEITGLVAQSGLESIEWGGDIHVPHGQVARAAEVRQMSEAAGLAIAAYGSYYRLASSEAGGLHFEVVLETALALGAPTVRVWAGDKGSAEADGVYRSIVIEDARRIADLAQAAGISISFEYHSRTLTDTNASAAQLLREIDHRNVRAYWQPPVGASPEYCLQGLHGVSAWLSNVHVFHWQADKQGVDRRPLIEGAGSWASYLGAIAATGRDHYALIEFVRDDAPDAFLRDAEVLRGWLARVSGGAV